MTMPACATAPAPGAVVFRAPPERPRLAAALAGSLAVHLFGAVAVWTAVGLGDRWPGSPFATPPLRAVLATPATVTAPAPMPASATAGPTRSAVLREAAAPAPVPLPTPYAPAASPPDLPGVVSVLPDDGAPLAPSLARAVASVYPGAFRAPPQFDVAPAGRYPEAARHARVQALVPVVVIVRDDGTVEVAAGTFDDPLFGATIEEALAGAKAQPAIVDGVPRTTWSVLTFYFEAYGSAESQRTRHERPEAGLPPPPPAPQR